MIGRTFSKTSGLLVLGVLTLGMATVAVTTHPSTALAAALDIHPQQHVISFQSNGSTTQHATTAQSVGAFLKERGITVGPHDYVHPSVDAPLTDNLAIEYHVAVPVRIVTAHGAKTVLTSAADIGALLEERGIVLGKYDEVHPSLADLIVGGSTIRVVHVSKWVTTQRHAIAAKIIRRIDFSLPPGKTKVIAVGSPGERDTMVRFTRRDDGKAQKHVLISRIVRRPKARIIAQGVGEYAAFADAAGRGLEKTSYVASSGLSMVATAYTAGCAGCSGITATGYRAGHGIVAVDPRVIALGTKLYIPGYGAAVAGDTGGAIIGNRIDLGFNSLSDALRFGRRVVTVYRLR